MIKTSDKVVPFLPETMEEFQLMNGAILPAEIESDKDCGGEIDIINLTTPSNVNVERFVANTDACSIHVIATLQITTLILVPIIHMDTRI